jgi:N-acetylmuramoyl-L-alanine amidase
MIKTLFFSILASSYLATSYSGVSVKQYTAPCDTPIAGITTVLRPVDNYTPDEISILTRIVEAEYTGKDFKSKLNGTSTILNRVDSKEFPDTIKDVVFQRHQFSPISDGRYWSVDVTTETKEAVMRVIMTGRTTDALFFCNLRDVKSLKTTRWFKSLEHLSTRDTSGHTYYK